MKILRDAVFFGVAVYAVWALLVVIEAEPNDYKTTTEIVGNY